MQLTIGIDGNAGYALLGKNLQEGEAEFVTITGNGYDGTSAAMLKSFMNLQERLPNTFPEWVTGLLIINLSCGMISVTFDLEARKQCTMNPEQ